MVHIVDDVHVAGSDGKVPEPERAVAQTRGSRGGLAPVRVLDSPRMSFTALDLLLLLLPR
jgi:hypothetical protein